MAEEIKVDPQIIAELKRITEKDPSALTPSEADFLRARKPYLGKNSRAKFADVFNSKPVTPEKVDDQAGKVDTNTQADQANGQEKKKKRGRPANPPAPADPYANNEDDESGDDESTENSEVVA